mmetsp:Transcript_25554/g.54971  ORF Transcript_25554/g.54971 Transcript_25554/m.54971 type:complete len:240 (+) Transcript_25554:3048-3767(+)
MMSISFADISSPPFLLRVDFSAHQSLRIEGIPLLIVLCKSNGTAVTPVRGKIRFATLSLASLTFSMSSDKRNMPPVMATIEAALTTSSSVSLVDSPRSMQSGSLCHQRCPKVLLDIVLRSMPLNAGKVPLSQCGKGNSGTKLGPVSQDTLIPSTKPTAVPIGLPQPIMNVSSPAAARMVRNPKCIASARLMVGSYFPFPDRQDAYKKSSFKTSKPHSSTARRMVSYTNFLTAGLVASSP